LNVDAPFSSPEFDYRGKTEFWDMIASGEVLETDLTMHPSTSATTNDFFQIPFELFDRATVPANGGMRSFYIATKTNRFIYGNNAAGYAVNDYMDLVESDDAYAPEILVGEAVLAYPWDSGFFFDYAILFVGEVYYDAECDSDSLAPSTSALTPDDIPTIFSPGQTKTPTPTLQEISFFQIDLTIEPPSPPPSTMLTYVTTPATNTTSTGSMSDPVPSPPFFPTISPAPSTNQNYCGVSQEEAQNRCAITISCPDGLNSTCLYGQACFRITKPCDTTDSAVLTGSNANKIDNSGCSVCMIGLLLRAIALTAVISWASMFWY